MVFSFQISSIRNKLTLAILLSCSLLLVVVGGSFLVVEFYASRAALSQELRTLGSSLATNSSRPLVLGKYDEIEDILASLKAFKNVHAAYLFNDSGRPVAEYLNQQNSRLILSSVRHDFRSSGDSYSFPSEGGLIFGVQHLSCFVPVHYDGKTIGSIYILSDLKALYARLAFMFSGSLIAFFLLLTGSWFMARWIQRPLSAPLVHLAEVMKDVRISRRYSLRAEKASEDEVGFLVDGFNRMLEQIEDQQASLLRYQDSLEETVAERTSELRETIRQLDIARQQADAANEAKSEFLSKMTHELRTPLIGVLGMNELLQRTQLNEQQTVLTETVQKSGQDLLALISDILDISKIEAGKLKLEPEVVELYRVVEDVTHLLAPKAGEKGISMVCDISAEAIWKVSADAGRIRQILMNLIGNAIKFTDTGSIMVGLDCPTHDVDSGEFVLSVADTGIGMDETVKQKVFEMFYQPEAHGGGREHHGAGLGLAIVWQLVELMSGQLSLETAPGSGSCFRIRFSLPLIEKGEVDFPKDVVGRSALLCMQPSAHRACLAKRLKEIGCVVVTAASDSDLSSWACSDLRAGERAPLVFADATIKSCDQRFLNKRVTGTAGSSHVPMITLCSEADHCIDSEKDHIRLKLPLKWSCLHDAISSCFPEPQADFTRTGESSVAGVRSDRADVFLLGQTVASRELSRILLEQNSIKVTVIDCLSRLPLSGQTACLLIDLPYQPVDELEGYLSRYQHLYTGIYLICSAPVEPVLEQFNLPQLSRPLRPDEIETLPLSHVSNGSSNGHIS